MNPFPTIAVSHSDISEGRLIQAFLAADMWECLTLVQRTHKDVAQFFGRTYVTDGPKNLLSKKSQILLGVEILDE